MRTIVLSVGLLVTLNLAAVPAVAAGVLPISQPTVEPVALESTVPVSELTPEVKLLQAIKTARATLQARVDAEQSAKGYTPKVVKSRDIQLPLTLALWDAAHGSLSYVTALKYKRTLKLTQPSPYDVRVRFDNGVNTDFQVVGKPEVIVVGIIHPVFTSIGTTKKPKFKLTNIVYVPYSDALEVPAIVAAGENYLNQNISAVYQEIRTLGVHSRTFPDQLLADVIPAPVVKSIIAIEHVSASALLKGNTADYLSQFYTTLATNQEQAYAYARSTASARGLVQFIPSTYQLLVHKRPELTLHKDFEFGMTDVYNAIKATVGLLDQELAVLPAAVRNQAAEHPPELGAYLAGMYNGGSTRVVRAVTKYGATWDQYHGATKYSLRRETTQYIAKYRAVYSYLSTAAVQVATVP